MGASESKKNSIYERLRNESLARYYKSPNFCKSCNGVIWVPEGKKVSEIKRRKFCNEDCKASFNKKQTESRNQLPKIEPEAVKTDKIDLGGPKKVTPSALQSFKRKQREKKKSISAGRARRCEVCGDEYDYSKRVGKPGKITHCEDCAEEVEDKYIGNWTPSTTGSNLNKWDVIPVKGQQHIPRRAV